MKKFKVIITGASLVALVLTAGLLSGCGKKKSEAPLSRRGRVFRPQNQSPGWERR